jgi:hypothetical protein
MVWGQHKVYLSHAKSSSTTPQPFIVINELWSKTYIQLLLQRRSSRKPATHDGDITDSHPVPYSLDYNPT